MFKLNNIKSKLLLLTFSCLLAVPIICQQEHELWWQQNLATNPAMLHTFEGWLGDENTPSRIAVRNHVIHQKYTSILDAACGLCTEKIGYYKKQYKITYIGLDITNYLVELGKQHGIDCRLGSIEAIPLTDNSVDVTYARHILEHLPYYKIALNELVRVAKREAIIVFFLAPHAQVDVIDYNKYNGCWLYHNRYNKENIEAFLATNKSVGKFYWEAVSPSSELILHVIKKYTI